jgi:uncharacterized protein
MIGWWKRWQEARKEKHERWRDFEYIVLVRDFDRWEQLLKEKRIGKRDIDKYNLLFRAVDHRDVEAVRMLLRYGANPNKIVSYGWETESTALIGASDDPSWKRAGFACSVEILSLLLKHKADPNQPVRKGMNPLYVAANAGNLEGVKLLLAHGANPNRSPWNPLEFAAKGGHLDIVKALLKAGACVKNNQALQFAASEGHIAIVQTLLDAGADINEDGDVLYGAVYNGHAETVRLLVDRGADVNAGKSSIRPPLVVAEAQGYEEIALLLREAGAKPSRV